MTFIRRDGQLVTLHFYHIPKRPRLPLDRGFTTVWIHEGLCVNPHKPDDHRRVCDNDNQFKGQACCAPKDNFSKALGRKYAIRNALTSMGLELQARTEFWEDYFKARMREANLSGDRMVYLP